MREADLCWAVERATSATQRRHVQPNNPYRVARAKLRKSHKSPRRNTQEGGQVRCATRLMSRASVAAEQQAAETATGGFIARGWRPRRRAAEAAEGGGGARECGSGGRCERQRTGRQGHEQVASMTMLHRLRASTPAPQAPAPEMPAPETPAPETPPPGCVRDPCACHHALWQRVLVLAGAAAAAAARVLHARCLRSSVVSRVSTRGTTTAAQRS